jgi:hypothetical protein
VKRFVLRFWNAASCERASATTGAKARLVLIALRGAEAPLFHVTARAALPRHCTRRSSTSLHAPLFHVAGAFGGEFGQ